MEVLLISLLRTPLILIANSYDGRGKEGLEVKLLENRVGTTKRALLLIC